MKLMESFARVCLQLSSELMSCKCLNVVRTASSGGSSISRHASRKAATLAVAGGLLITGSSTVLAIDAVLADDVTLTNMAATAYAGKASTLTVGGLPTSGNIALIKFDLVSVLPSGLSSTNIAKATLRVYSPAARPGKVDVKRVLSDWNEDSAIPRTQVRLGTEIEARSLFSANGKFVTFDVTELVKDWVDSKDSNHGLALVASEVNPAKVVLSSKEGGYGHSPSLDITLYGGGNDSETGNAIGAVLYRGSGAPPHSGSAGDIYFDTTNAVFYEWKDDTGWVGKSFIGPVGPAPTHIEPQGDVSMGRFQAKPQSTGGQ